MRAKRVMMGAVAAAAIVLAGPALADTKTGVDAWERGDYRTAVDEWRKLADRGDADAQYNLAQAYKLGRGVPLDTKQAEALYGKAAAQGHVQAQDNYGLALFQNGRPRDAVPYLEKSVARGEPRAQYILGTMLFNGVDIKKDWVRAYALTTRAAQAGLPQATQSLQQMDGYLSATDKQQGIALAQRMDSGSGAPVPGLPGAGSGAQTPIRTADRGLPPAPVPRDASPRDVPPSDVAPRPVPPRQAAAAPRPTPAIRDGGWRLQLGAFGDAGNARRLGGQVAGRFPGRTVDYVRAGTLTRVLVGPFATSAEAARACGSLKPCVPVPR